MSLPVIARLPDALANQIAAGEVIERPASVVKELVENALDAGARHIRIETSAQGLGHIAVQDDGHGIPPDQLPLALERHATSKITTTADLFHIHTFGFRGEALPSIASVARLTLTSRATGSEQAWQITPDGILQPAAFSQGTRIEVADLFYATPARRKFLKSDRTEQRAVHDVLLKMALAHPAVTFTLIEDGAEVWHIPAAQGDFLQTYGPRLAALLGPDFSHAALPLHAERTEEGISLHGFISPPTVHAATNRQQYLFVNGRPVKDRSLLAAIKQGYGDVIPHGRHPLAVLFLTLPADEVDVNVHPAKSEVRFRNGNHLFGFIYAAIRQTLAGTSAATTVPVASQITPNPIGSALGSFGSPQIPSATSQITCTTPQIPPNPLFQATPQQLRKADNGEINEINQHVIDDHPLGAAVGQIGNTYILAETPQGAVLVDQHAAHERIIYQRLKAQFGQGRVASQPLLLPAIVPLPAADAATLLTYCSDLEKMGLVIESYSPTAVAVTALPALLGEANPAPLIRDLVEDFQEVKSSRNTLNQWLERVLSTFACHHSIRAHRRLSLNEMNDLLRQIETTPDCLTCNHGRPTVVQLPLLELEKLFERK